MSVGRLRKWIDDPRPMGLPKEVQNLVMLIFAEQTNRTFYRHGAPWEATLATLPDDCELREQKLPDQAKWTLAVQRAGSIFGVAASPSLNASNVASLVTSVQQKARDSRSACQAYSQKLREQLGKLGLQSTATDRFRTAAATLALVEQLNTTKADDVVGSLASAAIATTEAAMGKCLTDAAALKVTLEGTSWDLFEAIADLTDGRKSAVDEILASVTQVLRSDEHVVQLAPRLREAQAKALRLLRESTKPLESTPSSQGIKPTAKPGKRIVGQGAKENLGVAAAKALLSSLERDLLQGRDVRVNINWIIEEDGTE